MGIIISGFADAPAVKLAIDRHELFAFLAKPWKAEEMRKIVAEAVAVSLAGPGTPEQRRQLPGGSSTESERSHREPR